MSNKQHQHQLEEKESLTGATTSTEMDHKEKKTPAPVKKTLIRVSSGEISSSAASVLNKLSTVSSSTTHRQHQQNSMVKTALVAILFISCMLIATDFLSRKAQPHQKPHGFRETVFNIPPKSDTTSGEEGSKDTLGNDDDNKNEGPQQQQQQATSAVDQSPSSSTSSSSSSSSLFVSQYNVDMSDYWSQPGSKLFSGEADPKTQQNGVIYEKDLKVDNRVNERLGRKQVKMQNEIFKCYYDSEKNMNRDYELGKSPKSDTDKENTNNHTLSFITPPKVVPTAEKKKQKESNNNNFFYRYEFILFPVGCFGDVIPPVTTASAAGGKTQEDNINKACARTTSCRALNTLVGMVPCGRRPIGLILGDNFYPNGLTRRSDPRIATDFGTKFLRHKLFNFPWFGTVGNHDHKPHYQYRFQKDVLWVMPDAHHVTPKVFSSSTSSARRFSMQVFFVSTQWGYDRNWPHMQREAEWLDEELTKSTADLKIVASHEPIYTFTGFEHSRPLIHFIDPILRKHGVTLFIAAHAHSIQFHRCPGNYYQLVSAGFADNLHAGVRNMHPRGHFYIGRGSSAVAVNSSHVVVTAMDLDGRNIFNFAFDWNVVSEEVKRSGSKKNKRGLLVKNTKNFSSMKVPPEDFRSQFRFEGNGEIGKEEKMWEWGKLCDKLDTKMKAWWCTN